MAAQTEANRLNDVLKAEQDLFISREQVTLTGGAVIPLGAVVGRQTLALGIPAAAQGNTGNGALTDVALGSKTKVGTYRLLCVAAGAFAVIDPDGFRLADAQVGEPYATESLAFSLSAGAEAFVAGDGFDIPVQRGSRKVQQLQLGSVDGTQIAEGFVIDSYDATQGDVQGVIICRDAIVVASGLVWPEGATAEQKQQALAELAARGIITREEA